MQDILNRLVRGESLSTADTQGLFQTIMSGQAEPVQVAAILAIMQFRGPSIEEITGAAKVMRDNATPVKGPKGVTLIDTCGTGGDHAGTFNISTAAAIVAAAAGRPHNVAVAKHGNRGVSSKSGSSQVLELLGVKLTVASDTLTECLDQAGMAFCFAPSHHPAMKHVADIRARLGIATIFNMLGPLTNPAGADRQLMGVYNRRMTEPIARVLNNLGCKHAMVVHGEMSNGAHVDEIVTDGPTYVSHLQGGDIRTYILDPQAVGVEPGDPDELKVDGPEASATMIRRILDGTKGSPRNIVVLNAAAALVVAGVALDLHDAISIATEAIDTGAALMTLNTLVKLTQADAT